MSHHLDHCHLETLDRSEYEPVSTPFFAAVASGLLSRITRNTVACADLVPAFALFLFSCTAETNFKTQVEADIQPFRGILLGLFFVTTGSSLDVG